MQDLVDKTLRLVRISLLINAIQRVLRFLSGNLFYKSNDWVRKGLIADFDRTRPADQCQLVSRVDLWYRSQVKRLF